VTGVLAVMEQAALDLGTATPTSFGDGDELREARATVERMAEAAAAYRQEILHDAGHRGDLGIKLDDALAAFRGEQP
jgi:hypothetical protein